MGNYLADRRTALGLTQLEIANKVGVSEATISRWESGTIANMRRDRIKLYAEALQTTPSFIMDGCSTDSSPAPPGFQPMPEMELVPLVGRIACGEPITAEENVERMVSVPAEWHATFTLTCEGDSMAPSIQDGDLVAIRKQPNVEQGQIAAVRIGGEATLKRVYKSPDRLVLQPENTAYAPIVLVKEEINAASIEGLAVGLCRGL